MVAKGEREGKNEHHSDFEEQRHVDDVQANIIPNRSTWMRLCTKFSMLKATWKAGGNSPGSKPGLMYHFVFGTGYSPIPGRADLSRPLVRSGTYCTAVKFLLGPSRIRARPRCSRQRTPSLYNAWIRSPIALESQCGPDQIRTPSPPI